MGFNFLNCCSLANAEHLRECDCCDNVLDDKLLTFSKNLPSEVLCDDELLLRRLKSEKCVLREKLGEQNVLSNIKCKHEVELANSVVERFECFDLTIPTFALIVNSVVNQVLLSFRLSNYLGNKGLVVSSVSKRGDVVEVPSPFLDFSSKVDKLIIDACEKMHKLKFGEKHVNETVGNEPVSLDDLFKKSKVNVIEVEDEE